MPLSPRTVVIYAHPYNKSLCHGILEAVIRGLESSGQDYDVIDLHADGFDPRYTADELALFSTGGTIDPLVKRYQELLSRATRLIIIAPVWWSEPPATVKGFIDKVMKRTWAYDATPSGLKGRLTHIRQVLLMTTSAAPTWYLRVACGNAIPRVFLGTTLRQLGMRGRKWVNYGRVEHGGPERRRAHLAKVARLAATPAPGRG